MKKHRQAPAWLLYLLCGTGLAAAIFLALFFPDWYSRWTQSRMFQEVETKEREEISFTDSRNMNLRQRLLAVAQMQLDNEEYSGGALDPYGFLVEPEDPLRVLRQCQDGLEAWTRAGLVPEEYLELCRTAYEKVRSGEGTDDLEGNAFYTYVNTLQGQIPVYVVALAQGEEALNQGRILMAVLDADQGFLYYASVLGEEAGEYLARSAGFSSLEDLMRAYYYGETEEPGETVPEIPDFLPEGMTGGCEAAFTDDWNLGMEGSLTSGAFTGKAWRIPVGNQWGTGYAVLYGSVDWFSFMQTLLEAPFPLEAEEWISETYVRSNF